MTEAELREMIEAEVRTEEAAVARHQAIIQALAKHEGKKITRHFNRDLNKVGMQLTFRFGMIYVISTGREDWQHFLGYDNDPVYTKEKFEKGDACSGSAAIERNNERRAWLASDQPAKVIAAMDVMLAAIGTYAQAPFGPCAYKVHDVVKATLKEAFLWRVS